ncbi:EAL domain-containing protein [Terasakiella sp. A23]|uniref:EAL domain-containing protein n=1 Tax=Terasakiella sp. FCG-A23 TaxID=3080561 RepID=UPI0029540AE8|nr:EAL domain-containing protein [Terasakiella sp. A23]MDV7338209.1 EAL domain-containing protein [Terasakiella sp. A23]
MLKAKLRALIPSLSIGQIVLLLSLTVSVIAIVVVVNLSHVVHQRAISDLAREEARQTSQLVFQSLYSAMKKGWTKDEIQETIDRLDTTLPDLSIKVYRGEGVNDQFGHLPGQAEVVAHDIFLSKALKTGEETLLPSDSMIRFLFPVLAEDECLTCHTNAKVGDVNGVIDITYPIKNLKISLQFVTNSVIVYFAIIIVVIFALLYLQLKFMIARPITSLAGLMSEIVYNSDLSKRVDSEDSPIAEVSHLSRYFNKLLHTVQEYHTQLQEFAVKDPLSGLYNRRKFEEFLKHEINRSSRGKHEFCVVILDLDNFKHINDIHGHPVGDLALKEVGSILENESRRTDIVARLGADEFAILLPETTPEHGFDVAEKLRKLLEDTSLNLPAGRAKVQASFGLVSYPENGESTDSITISMDVAMYKAKRLGKNRVSKIDDTDSNEARRSVSRARFLQDALDEDRVEPFFQPIIDPVTGKIFAYEALARIRTTDNVIAAGDFIEYAEEFGMAQVIDERIFKKGFQALQANGNPDACLFLNVSSKTFADEERLRRLPETLKSFGLKPQQVVLEITEREALPHLNQIIRLVDDLRKQGLKFALDDFGSGFSSFMYLKYFTIDFVKIEGSFIRHMATDMKDKIMVEHIHSMASEFGLRTIAEFVEDEETEALLREIGIDLAQGFHYGRPSARLVDLEK